MSYNDITGAKLQTKAATENFRDGWDRIFGKKDKVEASAEESAVIDSFKQELEAELAENMKLAIGRELVMEKHPKPNMALLAKVEEKIFGLGGSQNAFDVPAMYEILKIKEDAKIAQRQSDDIRGEWYEYCLAQEDRGKPFPTFQQFFENVFRKRDPIRAQWLEECKDKKSGLPLIPFEEWLEKRK